MQRRTLAEEIQEITNTCRQINKTFCLSEIMAKKQHNIQQYDVIRTNFIVLCMFDSEALLSRMYHHGKDS